MKLNIFQANKEEREKQLLIQNEETRSSSFINFIAIQMFDNIKCSSSFSMKIRKLV